MIMKRKLETIKNSNDAFYDEIQQNTEKLQKYIKYKLTSMIDDDGIKTFSSIPKQ